MKLDGLNQGLMLVANFGVVAGLIFLAVEVQQNTTALQAAAIQESTNVAPGQILTLATTRSATRLGSLFLVTGMTQPDCWSSSEAL